MRGNGSQADGRNSAATPLREAFEKTRAFRDALRPEELLQPNLDVHGAAMTALGAYPAIEALIPELSRELSRVDLTLIRSIPLKADAASYAHSLYTGLSRSEGELPYVLVEATEARDLVHAELASAIKRGLLEPERLADFSRTIGYRNVGRDLSLVVTVAREAWLPVMKTRTRLTETELEHAENVSVRLWDAIAEREQAPAKLAEAALERQRALTLLVLAYDEARRALTYVRWNEDDVDLIAPSLYGGHHRPARQLHADAEANGTE
jgi:hypothetical protein